MEVVLLDLLVPVFGIYVIQNTYGGKLQKMIA